MLAAEGTGELLAMVTWIIFGAAVHRPILGQYELANRIVFRAKSYCDPYVAHGLRPEEHCRTHGEQAVSGMVRSKGIGEHCFRRHCHWAQFAQRVGAHQYRGLHGDIQCDRPWFDGKPLVQGILRQNEAL